MSEINPVSDGGEFQLSMPRRRELLLRFSRVCIANGTYQAYSAACERELATTLRFDPGRIVGLRNAQYAELPLFPVAEFRNDPHASGYMFNLARFDPDHLHPLENTDVPVATYVIEYQGKTVEALNVVWPQFTHEQANAVKEYALALTPDH